MWDDAMVKVFIAEQEGVTRRSGFKVFIETEERGTKQSGGGGYKPPPPSPLRTSTVKQNRNPTLLMASWSAGVAVTGSSGSSETMTDMSAPRMGILARGLVGAFLRASSSSGVNRCTCFSDFVRKKKKYLGKSGEALLSWGRCRRQLVALRNTKTPR